MKTKEYKISACLSAIALILYFMAFATGFEREIGSNMDKVYFCLGLAFNCLGLVFLSKSNINEMHTNE